MKSMLNVNLMGHVPAFRDAEVELENPATGERIVRKPFLDGTLAVRDIDPGVWNMKVVHPNLTLPIDVRPIRVFDQPSATVVPVPVPADLFRDSPIRDIPDADLGPVQAVARTARERVGPLSAKASGEVIRASDWNTLAGVVSDLANAVLQLASLVSPRGHDHPEIAEKIGEVQDNLRRFAEAYGKSLLELRREVEAGVLRHRVEEALQQHPEVADRVRTRIAQLEDSLQRETPVFTRNLALTGTEILTAVNEVAAARGAEGQQFLDQPAVRSLAAMATQYMDAGTQTRPEGELQTYTRSTTLAGPKLAVIVGTRSLPR
ncbi:MAG TPA: hypothetical protein VF519_00135 [Mycobacteriales bacterium]|jgi:hypothetical protein